MLRLFVSSVVFAALTAVPALARAGDPLAEIEAKQQKLFETVAPSVVFISRENAFGSGFFVDQDLVLTNAHVVKGRDKVEVVMHDGKRVQGTVVERASGDVDLALVRVVARARPLPLDSKGDLRVGTWVASVGHGLGGIWTFTTGMISNIYPRGQQRPVFQTQIPLNPGASGGPVFDREGRVLGIVTSGIEDSNDINFAIRTDVAFESLAGLSGKCACLVVLAPPAASIFIDGKLRGQGPRLVIAAEPKRFHVLVTSGETMKEETVTFPDRKSVDLR